MKLLFVIISLAVSTVCVAGNQAGTIADIFVRASDGLIYFVVNGSAKAGAPSCATFSYWIIRDENSNAGKLQYEMILSAQATGKTITVIGSNSCTRWSDGEDVDSLLIRQ
jgi:hypothetical protein